MRFFPSYISKEYKKIKSKLYFSFVFLVHAYTHGLGSFKEMFIDRKPYGINCGLQ